MKVVLLGAPCSGKGTLAENMFRYLGVPSISTGTMLRRELDKRPSYKGYTRKDLDSGVFAPDEIVTGLVSEGLSREEYKNLFSIDGFPRTRRQAKDLDLIVEEENLPMPVLLDAPDEVLLERAENRRICGPCEKTYSLLTRPLEECGLCHERLTKREDDSPPLTVIRRIHDYYKNMEGILDFYGERTLTINSTQEPKKVFLDFLEGFVNYSKKYSLNLKN